MHICGARLVGGAFDGVADLLAFRAHDAREVETVVVFVFVLVGGRAEFLFAFDDV